MSFLFFKHRGTAQLLVIIYNVLILFWSQYRIVCISWIAVLVIWSHIHLSFLSHRNVIHGFPDKEVYSLLYQAIETSLYKISSFLIPKHSWEYLLLYKLTKLFTCFEFYRFLSRYFHFFSCSRVPCNSCFFLNSCKFTKAT